MSNSVRLLTITVPLRKICAALPAVALIGAGIALSVPVVPATDGIAITDASSDSTAIVVPDIALTLPASAGVHTENLPAAVPTPPAPVPVNGAAAGGSSPMTLDSTGIPVRALEAYRRAASVVNSADPTCHIDWQLLAAIGRVESNHARFGGNQLNAAGIAQPGIIGIALDGSPGTARITDSDGGLLDQDSAYDRAVGPMQFIPSTWAIVAVDANGDGAKNPQDMADAATATAIYLCSGPGDLNRSADLYSALMRYNASDAYARLVTSIAAMYRLGVSALPAFDGSFAAPAPPDTGLSQPSPILTTMLGKSAPAAVSAPTPSAPASTSTGPVTTPPGTTPAITTTPVTTPGATTTPVTTAPVSTPPGTTAPVTTPPVSVPPVTTAPVTTAPVTTAPVTTPPVSTPPVTTAPVTTPPATTPPETTPPVTTPPVTTPPVTTPPETSAPAPAPTADPTTTAPASTPTPTPTA